MSEDRRRILEMLAQGKITAEEAEGLLDAVGAAPGGQVGASPMAKAKPRYLRVVVDDDGDRVNIRVPLQLLRAGVKLKGLIPSDAQAKVNTALNEKGIQFDLADLSPETLDELIDSLGELTVDVEEAGSAGAKVRVFCE
jgi:hypothetical protein